MIRLLLPLAFLAGPALAQDAPAPAVKTAIDPAAIDTCLTDASTPEAKYACVGRAADSCVEAAGTPSTMVQSECGASALEAWKTRLNQNYDALVAAYAATDPEAEKMPGGAAQAPLLEASQKAWLAWRDAQCTYVESFMQGGSGAGPLRLFCELELTGRRAVELGLALPENAQ